MLVLVGRWFLFLFFMISPACSASHLDLLSCSWGVNYLLQARFIDQITLDNMNYGIFDILDLSKCMFYMIRLFRIIRAADSLQETDYTLVSPACLCNLSVLSTRPRKNSASSSVDG